MVSTWNDLIKMRRTPVENANYAKMKYLGLAPFF